MSIITENGIDTLNYVTKDLDNLDDLGIYLAKETDINALKILKFMILVGRCNYLKKDFNINKESTIVDEYGRERKENIITNLSTNPQYFALELIENIIHNEKVDLSLEPFSNGMTSFDFWVRSLNRIEYDQDKFYKRYDMINKKLDIISYMIDLELLSNEDIKSLIDALEICVEKKFSYTNEQLFIMKEIINTLKQKEELRRNAVNLLVKNKISLNCSKENFLRELFLTSSKKESIPQISKIDELLEYQLLNDQITYMTDKMPKVIEKIKSSGK